MNQQTLWANISFDLGEAVSMTLSDITVAHDAAGTTVDGTGTVVSPSFDGSFTLTSVNWATMACLPSSGGVLYQPTAGAAATIDLLPTTPDDGIVDVTIAPFPAFPYMLFDPCPPMP